MPEREIPFEALSRTSFNICSAAAVTRRWDFENKNNYLSEGRQENILSYTLHGAKRIYVPGSTEPLFSFSEPGAVFIGEGAPYISETLYKDGDEVGQTICVRFRITDEEGNTIIPTGTPLHFPDDKSGTLLRRFQQIFECYIRPSTSPAELKGLCYSLLCELFSRTEASGRAREFKNIMPAIIALEENPAADVPVSELAKMCWLSESHFRVRFKQYSGGLSPADYRNKLRIDKAEELLASSLWTTDLIAETLGFYDTSHFYKIYKKFKGTTPKANFIR